MLANSLPTSNIRVGRLLPKLSTSLRLVFGMIAGQPFRLLSTSLRLVIAENSVLSFGYMQGLPPSIAVDTVGKLSVSLL